MMRKKKTSVCSNCPLFSVYVCKSLLVWPNAAWVIVWQQTHWDLFVTPSSPSPLSSVSVSFLFSFPPSKTNTYTLTHTHTYTMERSMLYPPSEVTECKCHQMHVNLLGLWSSFSSPTSCFELLRHRNHCNHVNSKGLGVGLGLNLLPYVCVCMFVCVCVCMCAPACVYKRESVCVCVIWERKQGFWAETT